MNHLDILSTKIERAQSALADPDERAAGERAINLLNSAAAAGRDLTLTPRQVRTLSHLIEGAHASGEVRRLSRQAGSPDASKIVPFRPGA